MWKFFEKLRFKWPYIGVNYNIGTLKMWPLAALEGWPLVRGRYREKNVRAFILWPHKRGDRWRGWPYTDYAGPKIPVHLTIASPFSRQIAIDNAGPVLALEPIGPIPFFEYHFVNIAPIYKQ